MPRPTNERRTRMQNHIQGSEVYRNKKIGRIMSPYYQFGVSCLLMLGVMLVVRLVGQPIYVWVAAFLSLVIFAIVNASLLVFANNITLYLVRSLLFIIVFWMLSLYCAASISGIEASALGPLVSIYFFMLFYYPVYLLVCVALALIKHYRSVKND